VRQRRNYERSSVNAGKDQILIHGKVGLMSGETILVYLGLVMGLCLLFAILIFDVVRPLLSKENKVAPASTQHIVAWCNLCSRTLILIDDRYECPFHNTVESERRRLTAIDKAVEDAWERNRVGS
jgi:hypothetical protein